jgi:hypothetical protein
MSTTPAIQYSGPAISPDVDWKVRQHLQLIYQKLGNHTQAFSLQQQAIGTLKAGGTTTVVEGGTGGGGSTTPGIPVNNQSGVTAYSTQSGDDGALIVFSDASAIAVSLTTQSPPWSCFITNQSALGGGTVTLTPAEGTVNGAATLDILPSYSAILCFDGSNWFAFTVPIVPVGNAGTAHEWVASYNAATGIFGLSQPAFTDISGIAQVAQGGTGTATPGLVAGTNVSITGSWPDQTINSSTTGLSVTITTAQLTPTGTQGSMTFSNGLLVNSTPAT